MNPSIRPSLKVNTRPEQLINLIVNHDYWEIINVQTIIVM